MDSDPIAVRHEAVLERLTDAARRDERILAAWLQGSRADGSADAFSDIDLCVAVDDEAYDGFDKLRFIERAAPVLVHLQVPGASFGVSGSASGVLCLLEGPVKLDLLVGRLSAFESANRPAVRMLLDKADVTSKLRSDWQPSEQEIAVAIDRLVRMTYQGASWPVRLLRRGHWLTHAYSELVLIHNVIQPLMLVQHDRRAFQRSQMTRERFLRDEERRELDTLAAEVLGALAGRSAADAYRAHLRIHELLGRVGRVACTAFGLEFPEAAEREALRFYEREWPK